MLRMDRGCGAVEDSAIEGARVGHCIAEDVVPVDRDRLRGKLGESDTRATIADDAAADHRWAAVPEYDSKLAIADKGTVDEDSPADDRDTDQVSRGDISLELDILRADYVEATGTIVVRNIIRNHDGAWNAAGLIQGGTQYRRLNSDTGPETGEIVLDIDGAVTGARRDAPRHDTPAPGAAVRVAGVVAEAGRRLCRQSPGGMPLDHQSSQVNNHVFRPSPPRPN